MGSPNRTRSNSPDMSIDVGRDDYTAAAQLVSPLKHPFFCTWADCSQTFRHKFEWMRHEEAKHYWPYHWICCLEDDSHHPTLSQCLLCDLQDVTIEHVKRHLEFRGCQLKDYTSRVFLREDQLAQHIKGFHLKEVSNARRIPKTLLLAWKTDNPSLPEKALYCGFCGKTFDKWADRTEHVTGHFKTYEVSKTSWLLDR